MHSYCLISSSGSGRTIARPPQELDQPPTLKARRRNAVQGRRLAMHISHMEKNLAAMEAERAREVRHLREELRHLRAPLMSHSLRRQLSPRHHHVLHAVHDHHGVALTRDGGHQHHHFHHLSHHNQEMPPDQFQPSSPRHHHPYGHYQHPLQEGGSSDATHEEIPGDALPQEVQAQPNKESTEKKGPSNEIVDSEKPEDSAQGLDIEDNPIIKQDPITDDKTTSQERAPDDDHVPYPKGIPFRRLSLPRALQSISRSSNIAATTAATNRQTVGESAKGPLPPIRAQHRTGDAADNGQKDKNSVAQAGETSTRDDQKPTDTAGVVLIHPARNSQKTGESVPAINGQASKSRHIATIPTRFSGDTAGNTGWAGSKEPFPRSPRETTTRTTPTVHGHKPCALAGIADHKCTHFPCVQPNTYHSLGFHPDPSTHSWRSWLHMTANRPHHRLTSGRRAPVSSSLKSGRETPPDVPLYSKRRGLGKKEHVRLEIMARRKHVHAQDRPPSWNTNYGEPTPYKRLKNPVRGLQPRD